MDISVIPKYVCFGLMVIMIGIIGVGVLIYYIVRRRFFNGGRRGNLIRINGCRVTGGG